VHLILRHGEVKVFNKRKLNDGDDYDDDDNNNNCNNSFEVKIYGTEKLFYKVFRKYFIRKVVPFEKKNRKLFK
jgi:hypothetical protein